MRWKKSRTKAKTRADAKDRHEDENEGRGHERGEKVSGANWEAWLHLQPVL